MKRVFSLLAFVLLASAALAQHTVSVDATDCRRGMFHTHLTIAANAGPLTLVYPKWIPGEHMPTGPITQLAGLHFRASRNELAWSRDRVDPFAFHLDVPAGASAVDVDLDYLSPVTTFGGGYG